MIAALARREVIPRLAPGLRKLLGQPGVDGGVALALGTQGDAQDGPRLLDQLRQRPDSLEAAVGVLRTAWTPTASPTATCWGV
jgi:hypothetical protein